MLRKWRLKQKNGFLTKTKQNKTKTCSMCDAFSFLKSSLKIKFSAKQVAWQKYFQRDAVAGRCSVKMVFLKISQNSQNATLLKRETCEFCEIF